MFALIQRGQIYADQHGWPVIIHSCTSQIVRYWRQGRINTASIDRFNNDFEHLDHREAAQIRVELETSEHIKSLRAQRAACGESVKPYESKKSQFTRNLIRRRHAEWSEKTFGNVGPIGPLKHLSKEALEAAADPGDLNEWADLQFLLWDAQRRAGITDEQITAALEEKLKVNMTRHWPEPKDGEPRLHIKP